MTAETAFWDRIAPKYAARPVGDAAAYEATLARTRQHLSPSDRVLEIGCGTGSTALALAPDVGEYVATDISPAMLDIAREKAWNAGQRNLSLQRAAADRGVLPEGPFDAILAFSILHLLDDLDRGLAECHARLRPGGRLISKTPCIAGRLALMRPVIAAMQLFGKAPHVLYFPPKELERRLRAAGFEIDETVYFHKSRNRPFFVARKI